MKINKTDELLKEYRNEKSMELFDLSEDELNIGEKVLLEKFIYDLEHPIWKPIIIDKRIIKYEINNTGLVKNIETGYIRKGVLDQQNYTRIKLYINGIGHTFKIHRLVAQAFIPNPENKPQVNHIYPKHYHKNPKCNWVGNLEWNTPKENIQHAEKNGLNKNRATGERVGTSVYKESEIRKVCELLKDPYKHYKDISESTGVSFDVIARVATGELWTNVSKEYNLPKRINIRNEKYNDETVRKVYRMLQQGIKAKEINETMDIPYPIISGIKYRKKRYIRALENIA